MSAPGSAPLVVSSAIAPTLPDGAAIDQCCQCHRCTSGCPVAYAMDLPPSRLLHALRLGMASLVSQANSMWLCVDCRACTIRCPQGVDIAGVMEALRAQASQTPSSRRGRDAAFRLHALENVHLFGRLYETGLAARLGPTRGDLYGQLRLGIQMLRRGRAKLAPPLGSLGKARHLFSRAKGV